MFLYLNLAAVFSQQISHPLSQQFLVVKGIENLVMKYVFSHN